MKTKVLLAKRFMTMVSEIEIEVPENMSCEQIERAIFNRLGVHDEIAHEWDQLEEDEVDEAFKVETSHLPSEHPRVKLTMMDSGWTSALDHEVKGGGRRQRIRRTGSYYFGSDGAITCGLCDTEAVPHSCCCSEDEDDLACELCDDERLIYYCENVDCVAIELSRKEAESE